MTVAVVPEFSLAERERRWNLARSFMQDQNIDALLVIGEHEDAGPAPFRFDNWLTNDAPGAVVVFPRDADPVSQLGLSQATIGVAGLDPYLRYLPEGSVPYGLWDGIRHGCANARSTLTVRRPRMK